MENEPLISRQALNAFMVTIGVLLGSFLMLWIVTGDARISATMVVTAGMTIFLILVGVVIANKANHGSPAQPDVVTGDYEVIPQRPQPRLSAPSFVPIDDHLMVRKTQIENAAATVYMRMWPHTAPTRTNIMKLFPQMQSAGFVSAVQAYLRERGRVAGGGQGREYTWVVEDEDE